MQSGDHMMIVFVIAVIPVYNISQGSTTRSNSNNTSSNTRKYSDMSLMSPPLGASRLA